MLLMKPELVADLDSIKGVRAAVQKAIELEHSTIPPYLYALYTYLAGTFDRFHALLIAITAVILVAPLLMAGAGVDFAWCLAVLALAPWVTVVGYELHGHAHNARVLESLTQSAQ